MVVSEKTQVNGLPRHGRYTICKVVGTGGRDQDREICTRQRGKPVKLGLQRCSSKVGRRRHPVAPVIVIVVH